MSDYKFHARTMSESLVYIQWASAARSGRAKADKKHSSIKVFPHTSDDLINS